MTPEMINAIKEGGEFVREMFTYKFETPLQWHTYVEKYFGSPPSVETILDKEHDWTIKHFQALYVACWITQPVAKGSYMVKLTDQQRENIRHGYEKLQGRWTSHLHRHGRSGGKGWSFLKGYHELLIQLEGGEGKFSGGGDPYLFLKCEGHQSHKPKHIQSFFHKQKTGHGLTCNAYLENVCRRQELGITKRGAENFSENYKALVKQMGLDTKTTPVRTVVKLLHDDIKYPLKLSGTSRKTLRQDVGLMERDVSKYTNRQLATMITGVILPTVDSLRENHWFIGPVKAARKDLHAIAEMLQKDEDNYNPFYQRYFKEITLQHWEIDEALFGFQTAIL